MICGKQGNCRRIVDIKDGENIDCAYTRLNLDICPDGYIHKDYNSEVCNNTGKVSRICLTNPPPNINNYTCLPRNNPDTCWLRGNKDGVNTYLTFDRHQEAGNTYRQWADSERARFKWPDDDKSNFVWDVYADNKVPSSPNNGKYGKTHFISCDSVKASIAPYNYPK